MVVSDTMAIKKLRQFPRGHNKEKNLRILQTKESWRERKKNGRKAID